MKVASWEEAGLDSRRVALVMLLLAVSTSGAALAAGEVLHLGEVSFVLGATLGAGTCYLVATAPKRARRLAAFRQALEAPALAAASNVYLGSTSSRSRTLLGLECEEPRLMAVLAEAKRRTLLGFDLPSALLGPGFREQVSSEAAKTVLTSILGLGESRVEEGGEELDGMLGAGELERETKLPLLIAVSFFLPIMLMLFAAMARQTGPVAIAALVVTEVAVLDLAAAFSREEAGWRRGG